MRVIYVTDDPESFMRDPFFGNLHQAGQFDLAMVTVAPVLDAQVYYTEQQVNANHKGPCIIVIDAFLNPKVEGFFRGATDPSPEMIHKLLDKDSPSRLLSLQIMWKLRERLQDQVRIAVTVRDVQPSPAFEQALEEAFAVGESCNMYGWASNMQNAAVISALIEDLKTSK